MEETAIWLRVADIVASLLILVGLWGSAKNRRYWLVYGTGTVFFLIVTISKGLVGLTLMGVATLITAVRNWRYRGS